MTETAARPQLSDRYTATSGRVQLTGVQALARLPIDQHRRDLAAGLNVGTFVSGYEGSPLAGYDQELGRLKQLLDANDVTFVPGLNEEAAATSVQGSQLACTLPGAVRDGVIGIWYGKAPGLDRATDALRHGNLMGSHPKGGALVLVGDDPAAKSSTLPCASDVALADLSIPYLYPADSQDVLDLGRHAIELSRASGLWTGLKIVTAVADGSSPVDLAADRPAPRLPAGAGTHTPTARLLHPTLGQLERDLVTNRLRIAREYARLNGLNRVVGRGPGDVLGVVAAGTRSSTCCPRCAVSASTRPAWPPARSACSGSACRGRSRRPPSASSPTAWRRSSSSRRNAPSSRPPSATCSTAGRSSRPSPASATPTVLSSSRPTASWTPTRSSARCGTG